ncbi:hypothetical protein ABZV24_00960 [Streptomyces sp. NPDC005251]|uniref:hypothetical protein n=1 Tax=Streptomyces sp. NPDC005251 TaxID=3157166 RepID=UPI0033B7C248
MLSSLSAGHRRRLMHVTRNVSIPQGTRLFEEGGPAARFWIIRTGRIEGNDVSQWVGQIVAHRLRSARTRLLELYARHGTESTV